MGLGETCKLKLYFLGASDMAQWEKVLAVEPDPLEFDPQNPHSGRRKFILASCPLTSMYVL